MDGSACGKVNSVWRARNQHDSLNVAGLDRKGCIMARLLTLIAITFAATDVFGQSTVINPVTADQQATFFHLPEGGAVMPLAYFDSMQVIDSHTGRPTGQTFAERMTLYGFLVDEQSDLPVGFGEVSLDFLAGLPGLSVNCAACHVGEIHFDGPNGSAHLRILGGPNLADVRGFSQDVYESIRALLRHPLQLLRLLVKLDRLQPETVVALHALPLAGDGNFGYRAVSREGEAFAEVLSEWIRRQRQPTSPSKDFFLGAASRLQHGKPDIQLAFAVRRREPPGPAADLSRNLLLIIAEAEYFIAQGQFPLTTREGFGRLDAFGTVRYLIAPEESRGLPFSAPVSVPHLWGTGQKKWLHWNANTNSTLQRNMIQSLGMGALSAPGGVNNILLPNLHQLEVIAETIPAPEWPVAVFGPLDINLLARGEELYESRCAFCHDAGQIDPATGLVEYPLFTLVKTGTDPNHALNFHQPVGGKSLAQALSEESIKLQTWYYRFRDPRHPVPKATQIQWGGGEARMPAVWRDPLAAGEDRPVYAALPLTGVWATAPYLHNNSVPALRDLLKPAAERPMIFRVGQRDYDPQNVGYAQPDNLSNVSELELFDTHDAGNSNAGHDGPAFGAEGLTSEDIDALLEYLKSL